MERATLAKELTDALAPAIPYLTQPNSVASDERARSKLGAPNWNLAQTLWRSLKPYLAGKEALADVAVMPDDEDARAALRLLLDRGGHQYGFIHLTFQEYLAAMALAQQGQLDITPIVEGLAAHIDDPTWHEVSLLCVAYLGIVQQNDQVAVKVLEALLDQAPGQPGQATVLAGESVADAGQGGVTPECRTRVVDTLLGTLRDDENIEPKQRAAAGSVLARIGDPRTEVTDVDAMTFCFVPAGAFLMGDAYQEYDIDYDYWIARYPVTVAHYRLFIRESGQKPKNPACLSGADNHPVVYVDWYEACAFCDWLTKRWQAKGLIQPGRAVVLPSEPEWEKAARGAVRLPRERVAGTLNREVKVNLKDNSNPKRRYPWGDEEDTNRANYSDTDIWTTSAMGCFPGGRSPYGAEEMCGNVFEWSRSIYGDLPYPNDAPTRRSREDLSADDPRVLRGGAFYLNAESVRCARRNGYDPDLWYYRLGFRVVVSPFFSER